MTSPELQLRIEEQFGFLIPQSSIRRFRYKLGYVAVQPTKMPFILVANQQKRVDFCNQLLASGDNCDDVIFTDESSVQIGLNNRIMIAKIIRDENGKIISKDVPTIEKLKHPLKVHVWGGISRHGPTQVRVFVGNMDAKFYTEEILQNTLLPAIRHLYPAPLSHRLWADNDPKHCSKLAKNFLEENNVNWFRTPAESPDLNMIENVWAALKGYVGKVLKMLSVPPFCALGICI